MSLMISSSCCCSADGTCCSTEVNTSASITDLIQCQAITIQNSQTCVANGGIVLVPNMGINCEGQTCIFKDVPLGQIIKHCLHTDICAYDSFSSLVPDGADWYPNWGCGLSSNYTLVNGVTTNIHRSILYQPIGGTSGFTFVEDQMEVACVPLLNNKETCGGNFYTDLGIAPASPYSVNYANTLKDRVTGSMTVETIFGTVGISFVGDIDRGALGYVYHLYAAATCGSSLSNVLDAYTVPSNCDSTFNCPTYRYRYGLAGTAGSLTAIYGVPSTSVAPVDSNHNTKWCQAVDQVTVYLGKLLIGQLPQQRPSISATGGTNGSGYFDAQCVFTGGGGTGMTADAYISQGAVVNVIITSFGCGYTSAPTLTITSATGSGATRNVVMTSDATDAGWTLVLDGLGEGSDSARDQGPSYPCNAYPAVVFDCLSGGQGNFTSWAVSAGNPVADRHKIIGAPYSHWLGGNQTFVFTNPIANVESTDPCVYGGTQRVRSVTVEITGSANWAIGGEVVTFPLSAPCDYAYNSLYPTQPAVVGGFEIGTVARDPCTKTRFIIRSEYGAYVNNIAAFSGTGTSATYSTAKTYMYLPVTTANKYPTVLTYDYDNFGKVGSTPLKKTYYDAFYVYKNPRLAADTTGFNKHLDVTQAYAGIAGSSFSVTFLGKDFIGMKKAELRGTTLSPNTANNLDNTVLATTTTITNTGINLDPANCTTVTVGFPSTSEHRFMYVFLFNNYIDRSPTTGNGIKQGVFVFGVPTAVNTSVISASANHNVAYNLDPNQSVYMGGTVQPFKTIGYSRAPNETASIVVGGVTILDNPNNDLPNAQLGAGFGANLPGQLMGTVGTQSVVFTTYGGSVTLSRRQAITPKITAVSDLVFPKSGGTTLTLTGLDLNLLSAFVLVYNSNLTSTCTIVSQSATSVVLSTGALTGTDPVIATYALNLVATYASESLLTWGSQTSYLGGFTFTMVSEPTITSVTPSSTLATAGGTSVVIVGKHFVHMVSVTFKGVAVTPTINSATQMTCIAPANSAGSGQLVITTLGGSASFAITYV